MIDCAETTPINAAQGNSSDPNDSSVQVTPSVDEFDPTGLSAVRYQEKGCSSGSLHSHTIRTGLAAVQARRRFSERKTTRPEDGHIAVKCPVARLPLEDWNAVASRRPKGSPYFESRISLAVWPAESVDTDSACAKGTFPGTVEDCRLGGAVSARPGGGQGGSLDRAGGIDRLGKTLNRRSGDLSP